MIGICAVVVLPVVHRRLDLDSQGISFVPLIPLRRTQTFQWSEVGSFERKTGWLYRGAPSPVYEAPIFSGRKFCVFWIWRSSKLGLSGAYAASPFGRSLDADALLALVASYRSPAGEPS